jgi:flagellar M-ring protein FliF
LEHDVKDLLALWSTLSLQRRFIVIGATAAMFLAIVAMGRAGSQQTMALLFAGLENAAAGEVITALEQQGATYEVRGNAIYVPEVQRDSLRMTLASQGLPAAGSAGYELLDNLSGFGTTSQMFGAAYWRAKEGELSRTIQSNPSIRAARVHIATAPDTPFQADIQPSASVTVTTAAGNLRPEHALALRHLVAAAVPGMLPKDVALIDSLSGLIPLDDSETAFGSSPLDRAAALKTNLERLLEARVGAGKAIVEVTFDVETSREEISERVFDPAGRVAISSETEERTDSAGQSGSQVTVASNLPEGDAGAGGNEQSQSSETRERINYEVSETSRAVLRAPGATRKISVAVLLDEASVTAADGTVTQTPRSDEELAILRDLVSSAMGFDEARGDVLTVRSLGFQPLSPVAAGSDAASPAWISQLDLMQIIQIAVFGIVALVLGLFVLRPILLPNAQRRAQIGADARPLALPSAGGSGFQSDQGRDGALTGEIQDAFGAPAFQARTIDFEAEDELPEDPVSRLRRLIDARQSESIEILRGWMEKEEETT